MVSIPVVLDNFSWPTRSSAEAAYRSILRNSGYAVGDVITDPVHHQMLVEVLDRHPDRLGKIGSGVKEFFIGRTRDAGGVFVGANAIGIWVRRTDGSEIDFSYRTAIYQPSPRSDAKEALRTEVDYRRQAYREKRFGTGDRVVSDLSEAPIDDVRDAQVVYLTPSWGQLTYRFAELEGGWQHLVVAPASPGSASAGSRLADREQVARWLAFHAEFADLGLASASEAARRSQTTELDWVIPNTD